VLQLKVPTFKFDDHHILVSKEPVNRDRACERQLRLSTVAAPRFEKEISESDDPQLE
jgi:hypothetical protein